jgi:hypothetical protein
MRSTIGVAIAVVAIVAIVAIAGDWTSVGFSSRAAGFKLPALILRGRHSPHWWPLAFCEPSAEGKGRECQNPALQPRLSGGDTMAATAYSDQRRACELGRWAPTFRRGDVGEKRRDFSALPAKVDSVRIPGHAGKFRGLQRNSLTNRTGNYFGGTGNFGAGTGIEVFGTHRSSN